MLTTDVALLQRQATLRPSPPPRPLPPTHKSLPPLPCRSTTPPGTDHVLPLLLLLLLLREALVSMILYVEVAHLTRALLVVWLPLLYDRIHCHNDDVQKAVPHAGTLGASFLATRAESRSLCAGIALVLLGIARVLTSQA